MQKSKVLYQKSGLMIMLQRMHKDTNLLVVTGNPYEDEMTPPTWGAQGQIPQ